MQDISRCLLSGKQFIAREFDDEAHEATVGSYRMFVESESPTSFTRGWADYALRFRSLTRMFFFYSSVSNYRNLKKARNRNLMAQHLYGNHKIGWLKRPKRSKADIERRRDASRTERIERAYDRGEEVRALAAQGYDVESINGPYQYRVNGELDIYPRGHKWVLS